MKKLFLFIQFISLILLISNNLANAEQYELPELPPLEINQVENELEDMDEKKRAPSNSKNKNESEYQEPSDKIKTWDYQNIIDRHDKH